MENCVLPMTTADDFIVTYVSMAKCMYEVGNSAIADYLIDAIRSQYPENTTIGFYIFLYNIEKGRLDLAKQYTNLPMCERDVEREVFT